MFTSFDGGWLCDSSFKGLPEVFATLPLRCPVLLVFRPIHHFQHAHAASSDEADHQDCRQHQKDDIEHSGIVPVDTLGKSNHVTILWDDPKRRKQELDDIASGSHSDIEGHENIAHHLPSIIFAVDVQNGQNDQIGKDEADDPAEADPTPPEHGCQWHVAHRTNETHDGNQRSHEWPFNPGPGGII